MFLRILTACLAILCANIASAKPQIEWELRFPFRMFGEPTAPREALFFKEFENLRRDWEYRKQLYFDEECRGKIEPILCSEKRIGSKRRAIALSMLKDPNTAALIKEYGKSSNSNAWIATAFLSAASGYSDKQMRHRSLGVSEQYKFIQAEYPFGNRKLPSSVTRRKAYIWISGLNASSSDCEWNVDGVKTVADCREKVRFGLLRGKESSNISVTVLGTDEVYSISGVETEIREHLIVGLGDSYASGEGAPDFAAISKMKNGKSVRIPAFRGHYGELANAAHWAERNCHRSHLSSQSRAAIHYAVTHPKTETIFLHLACSGAEIRTGVLGTYSGALETNRYKRSFEEEGEVWRTTLSQINQIIIALCIDPDVASYRRSFNSYFSRVKREYRKQLNNLPYDDPFFELVSCPSGFKRDIDAIMISIGGNDFGFFPSLRWAMASWVERQVTKKGIVTPEEAGKRVQNEADGLFQELQSGLLNNLPVKAENVILSQYPVGLFDENGEYCTRSEGGLSAFNIIRITEPEISEGESKRLNEKFAVPLNKKLEKVAAKHGWVLVSEHLPKYKNHGWCAGDQLLPKNGSINAYAVTDRWIRTPDDGTVFQNQLPAGYENMRSGVMNRLLNSYGLFHPNGLGAAAWADSYYKVLSKVLETE